MTMSMMYQSKHVDATGNHVAVCLLCARKYGEPGYIVRDNDNELMDALTAHNVQEHGA